MAGIDDMDDLEDMNDPTKHAGMILMPRILEILAKVREEKYSGKPTQRRRKSKRSSRSCKPAKGEPTQPNTEKPEPGGRK